MTNMLALAGRTRTLRRGLVVLAALLVGVMVALSVTRDEANLGWAWWTAFLGFGLVWLVARSATGNVAEGRADRLDERELLQRYRAGRIGWTCLVVATLAVGFALTVVSDDPVLVARGERCCCRWWPVGRPCRRCCCSGPLRSPDLRTTRSSTAHTGWLTHLCVGKTQRIVSPMRTHLTHGSFGVVLAIGLAFAVTNAMDGALGAAAVIAVISAVIALGVFLRVDRRRAC